MVIIVYRFVWYGISAGRAVRLGALKVANQLLRAVKHRPAWVTEVIYHVYSTYHYKLFMLYTATYT
jgi:hypothetical protein